ncbi:MAG: alpha/beta fold hydrolase [Candidatus Rokuibacteriota bacterium]
MPSSMPAVFVHGVPDTERVWSGVIARLRRNDLVTLSLPGFGGEEPTGFDATKEAYLDWLLAELARTERGQLTPGSSRVRVPASASSSARQPTGSVV